MKLSQFLNFALARASMIALERAGPICGSLSSSAAVAVLRLVLATCGAVAAPVVAGFAGAGAVTAGPGFAGCAGGVPCAKPGTARSASIAEATRTRRVIIAVGPLGDPSWLEREGCPCAQAERRLYVSVPDDRHASRARHHPTDHTRIAERSRTTHG